MATTDRNAREGVFIAREATIKRPGPLVRDLDAQSRGGQRVQGPGCVVQARTYCPAGGVSVQGLDTASTVLRIFPGVAHQGRDLFTVAFTPWPCISGQRSGILSVASLPWPRQRDREADAQSGPLSRGQHG
jgi:hypothetical protein